MLLASASLALALANSPVAHAWHEFWAGTRITVSVGSWTFPPAKHPAHLEWWVNDAVMAVFFFVIGLELKREFLAGELRSPRKAALPLIAAVGGMAVPGLIYAAFNWNGEGLRGWAIPTATDIAFALGALAALGRRIPSALRVFLVTLAIADDLGALLIIAIFYTSPDDLSPASLGLAGAVMGVMASMNVLGVRGWWVYAIAGLLLWYFVLQSGVHATIAGVLAALTIPVRTRIDGKEFATHARRLADEFESAQEKSDGGRLILTSPAQQAVLLTMESLAEGAQPPLQRLESAMVPVSAFVVVPVFALANAGVSVTAIVGPALHDPVAWGIVLGLLAGKTAGIFGASYVAVRSGLCVLPSGVTWRHLFGAALLGGIGFTMSLFIAHLAFGTSAQLEVAKLAVLSGSAIAALLGTTVLLTCRSQLMPAER